MYLCALLPPDHLQRAFFALQTRLFSEYGLATARLLPSLIALAHIDKPLSRAGLLHIKQQLSPPRLRIGSCVWRREVLVAPIAPCEWLGDAQAALAADSMSPAGVPPAGLTIHEALGHELVLGPELCGFYVAWLPGAEKLRAEIAQWLAHTGERPPGERPPGERPPDTLRVYRLASLRIEPVRLQQRLAPAGISAHISRSSVAVPFPGLSLQIESAVWLKAS